MVTIVEVVPVMCMVIRQHMWLFSPPGKEWTHLHHGLLRFVPFPSRVETLQGQQKRRDLLEQYLVSVAKVTCKQLCVNKLTCMHISNVHVLRMTLCHVRLYFSNLWKRHEL